jgi:hypothetical protein
MFQKGQTRQFLASQAQAPRPLSEATEIYETDFEDDFSDTEDMSARRSIGSVRRVPLLTYPIEFS